MARTTVTTGARVWSELDPDEVSAKLADALTVAVNALGVSGTVRVETVTTEDDGTKVTTRKDTSVYKGYGNEPTDLGDID
jgi:hypothetical protein